MSASVCAGVSRLRGSCQAVFYGVLFVSGLVLGGSLDVAAAGIASTDVVVNDVPFLVGSGMGRDVVKVQGDIDTIVKITASSGNTGAFEPGSVTIDRTSPSYTGVRKGNKIIMTGGNMGYAPGGAHHIMAANGGSELRENAIEITGGTITNGSSIKMAGGYTEDSGGTAIDNRVRLTGSGVLDATVNTSYQVDIYGGYGKTLAKGNTVILSPDAGGKVAGKIMVYGGYATSGNAETNTVELGGAANVGKVYGGSATDGNAVGNTVTFGGTASADSVYGGSASGNASWNAEKNTVALGGTASANSVYGGYVTRGNAIGNTVTLGENSSAKNVYGAHVQSGGNVEGSTVTFEGAAKAERVYGGYAVNGGQATGNVVTVGGTAIVGDLHGGYASGSTSGAVSANVVNVRDNAKVKNIYGGYSAANTATDNVVNLYSAQALEPDSVLWGGVSDANLDARTGNTLAVYASGVTAANVKNFQHYRFHLPATITPDATMLTLTDPAGVDIRTPAGEVATSVGVGIMGGGTPLKYNDSVVLIKAAGGLQADANMTNTVEGMQGISKVYTFALEQQSDALLARVTNEQMPVEPGGSPVVERKSPEAVRKSPSEARAAAVTVVTQGGDLAAGQGMSNAREAVAASARQEAGSSSRGSRAESMSANALGLATFGAFSGGTARHKSGSHVDVNSFSLMAGLAKRLPVNGAEFLAGAFVEAGFGSYDSFNGQPNGPDITGWGNSHYMGGGLLGRVDLTDGAARGLYAESSFRVGSMYSSYKSDDLNPALGRADYSTSVAYVGLHGGLGYVWALSEKSSLDVYGKYFWTRTGSSDVEILGDAVHFDAVNSHRVRAGARYAYAVNANFSPYIGAAWEHEFAGDARSIVAGEAAPAPSLKGSSGMGEIGLTWKPSHESVLAIDLGMQGHVGMRQGVSGNAQLRVVF